MPLYSRQMSSKRPGCFIFLVDQSDSMSLSWGEDAKKTKADQVADVLNNFLRDLSLRCAVCDEIKKRIDIGIIGYGNKIGPAFSGALKDKTLANITEIAENPAKVEQRIKKVNDGAGGLVDTSVRFPIWFDATANGSTPMKEGFSCALQILKDWIGANQDSFPPIVINITDGAFTTGSPKAIADEIKNLRTTDGAVLLFNIHISTDKTAPILFPSTPPQVGDNYAVELFELSSELPGPMMVRAKELYPSVHDGARGFAFNADFAALVNFIDIGSSAERTTVIE